jgi:ABC-type polysaccharide/polyol phosphate export permease
MVHKKGDPDATSYCATLTAGAMPFTSFSTTCYTPASPGVAITAADVSIIDKISVQVSSGTAAITVASLCITGITFAK